MEPHLNGMQIVELDNNLKIILNDFKVVKIDKNL